MHTLMISQAQALTTGAADIDAFLAEPWAKDTTKTVGSGTFKQNFCNR